MQRKLSDTPRIVFVDFDDKPIDFHNTLTRKPEKLSPKEKTLQDYFKALYSTGISEV